MRGGEKGVLPEFKLGIIFNRKTIVDLTAEQSEGEEDRELGIAEPGGARAGEVKSSRLRSTTAARRKGDF